VAAGFPVTVHVICWFVPGTTLAELGETSTDNKPVNQSNDNLIFML
jgi:hypothetical protein